MRYETAHRWPGLELAGYNGIAPRSGALGAGVTDVLKGEMERYAKAFVEEKVLPKVRAEAAKGAGEAVKPMLIGVGLIAVTSLVLSLVAVMSRR